MHAKIALLAGDGVGPEVAREAEMALRKIASEYSHRFEFEEGDIGGTALDSCGQPLPESTLQLCREADAVFLGAVGGPSWDQFPLEQRPESGLLQLRKALGLYVNLRPVSVRPELEGLSPLKNHIALGTDFIIVRELTGGAYFGPKKQWVHNSVDNGSSLNILEDRAPDTPGYSIASDEIVYSEPEVARVVKFAGGLARDRGGRLISVDKANVLETSRLWRRVTDKVITQGFPDVELSHMLVDNCAMQLVINPRQFDVMVTENMFGDILSDEGAALMGSIGLAPSASLSDSVGLYEPIHGSAPTIANKGIVNPAGAILSAALLLRHSLGLDQEAAVLEAAVSSVIAAGFATPDLGTLSPVSTTEFGDKVRQSIVSLLSAGSFQ